MVVGLTGGIGSGKSTVAERFEARGVAVIDADVVARAVVEPGEPGLAAAVSLLGADVVGADGRLDRAVVRSRVFREPELRRRLEAALHPLIRAEMERRLTTVTSRYAILAIPLLVESGSRARVDRILVVDCSRETQLARTLARDGSDRATVEGILAAQATRDDRLRVADDVIDNDGPLEALEPQVERLHGLYLQIADDAR
ncbi:MAG: dephospho-CoA kinase [Chromatiales bacterium]|nr:dephospho-CoA kinase [Chromatiales bacterium]